MTDAMTGVIPVSAPDPAPSSGDHEPAHARLVVEGPDRPGIVAAVSAVLTRHDANILSLRQHSTDPAGGMFFQRTVFTLPRTEAAWAALGEDLRTEVGAALGLRWTLHDPARLKRVAVFASTTDHCLLDLLWRQRRGELPMVVTAVVSNHADLAEAVARFDVPFVHVAAGRDHAEAEAEHLRLLAGNVDLVVLARYMRILSRGFLDRLGVPVINIHHSFLPAFIGAGPYRKAKERGVKLIGATAHYVTEDLDEGPIIEQDVVRVGHGDSVAELVRRGADVERTVLSRAVRWHCEDRVVRHGNQTVVFTP